MQTTIQRRLAAEAQRDGVRPLALDHLLDELRRHRQEVDTLGERARGLVGRDVRIHQHRGDALLLEGLDRLAARVVELTRLADLERAAAEDKDFHRIISTNWSKRLRESTGPGAASGWNCTLMNGRDTWRMPSFEPSFALVYQGSQPAGSVAGSTA